MQSTTKPFPEYPEPAQALTVTATTLNELNAKSQRAWEKLNTQARILAHFFITGAHKSQIPQEYLTTYQEAEKAYEEAQKAYKVAYTIYTAQHPL